MLQDVSGRLAQPQAQAARQAQDEDDEYTNISIEMENVISLARAAKDSGSLTEEQSRNFKKQYYKLEKQRASIVADEKLKNFRPPQGPSPHETMLASAHPEVWYNAEAKEHAAHLAMVEQRRRARSNGRPLTAAEIMEVQHAALKQAGEELLGIRPNAPTPTNGERARFGGTGAASRSGGGKVTRALQEHERDAAKVMFPDVPESEAIARWCQIAERDGYWAK
jgi:hypothetical protein